jgi:hypothetical protein
MTHGLLGDDLYKEEIIILKRILRYVAKDHFRVRLFLHYSAFFIVLTLIEPIKVLDKYKDKPN